MPLNFLWAIYNGEISLKEAETSQRNLEKKIEELKFNYRPENAEEKEGVNVVLMQANDLLEYRNKIIDVFKWYFFIWIFKKIRWYFSHDYVVKDVYNSIQKIKSMFKFVRGFFWSSSPADYAEGLLNIKNSDKNKEIIGEIEDRISNLKDRIKEMRETEKNI